MWPAFRRDGSLNVVVETPAGCRAKYKHDPETGAMMLSRPLPAGVVYPFDWGFVPSTRAADGDPLDVMILWDGASFPGVLVASRLIGVLRVEQTSVTTGQRERNDRLFALPVKAPRLEHVRSVFDLPERTRLELEQFFLSVVAFEGKELKLLGFAGPDEADATLQSTLIE